VRWPRQQILYVHACVALMPTDGLVKGPFQVPVPGMADSLVPRQYRQALGGQQPIATAGKTRPWLVSTRTGGVKSKLALTTLLYKSGFHWLSRSP